MGKLHNEVWQINTTGKGGIGSKTDIAFGSKENGQPAIRIGDSIVDSPSVWESGAGEDSIQQKNTLCEATGNQACAKGLNTHAGGTASSSEGALTATRNDYDETTETGFDAAYSHVEGLNNGVNNVAEHGEGKYGWSYYVDNHDPAKSSIHYVGIGTNNQDTYRKNAEVIMVNGDKYVIGVGGYDGKNIEGAVSVQDVINKMTLYTHNMEIKYSESSEEIIADIEFVTNYNPEIIQGQESILIGLVQNCKILNCFGNIGNYIMQNMTVVNGAISMIVFDIDNSSYKSINFEIVSDSVEKFI